MEVDDKQAFVAAVAREHGVRLRRFLASRIRNAAAEIHDLTQEVYLRLLRVPEYQRIKNPQAYLITIANHVVHQHNLHLAASPQSLDISEMAQELESDLAEDPVTRAEMSARLRVLDVQLRKISPRVHATFVLHRRFGFSLEEIGAHLGVSRPMVKKYLAKAVIAIREYTEQEQERP